MTKLIIIGSSWIDAYPMTLVTSRCARSCEFLKLFYRGEGAMPPKMVSHQRWSLSVDHQTKLKGRLSWSAICPWLGWGTWSRWSLVIAPVLTCTPSVVRVTHGAPCEDLLLDFGEEPASQEFLWPRKTPPCFTCPTLRHYHAHGILANNKNLKQMWQSLHLLANIDKKANVWQQLQTVFIT